MIFCLQTRLNQPLGDLVEVKSSVPLPDEKMQTGELLGEGRQGLLSCDMAYLGGTASHVLNVSFGHLAAHVVDVVAVAVVLTHVLHLSQGTAGVHKRRVQRIQQVFFGIEPRTERRGPNILRVFVEHHSRCQRPWAPGPIR